MIASPTKFDLNKSMLEAKPLPEGLKIQHGSSVQDASFPTWNQSLLSEQGQERSLNKVMDKLFANQDDHKFVIPIDVVKDTAYQFTQNELTMIQNEIEHVRRWRSRSDRFISTRNIPGGLNKYTYQTWNDVVEPRLTNDFEGGRVVSVSKSEHSVEFIGFDYDIRFGMVQLDAMANAAALEKHSESLLNGTITEVSNSAAQYSEWMKHLGTDVPNLPDWSIKGIFNATGITDPGAIGIGKDDNLTAAGDVYWSAHRMAALLMIESQGVYEAPFTLVMTPGVFAQMLANIDTSADGMPSDYDLIKKSGLFKQIIVDAYLINNTETTTTGAMAVIADEPKNEILETYKLAYYEYPPTDLGRAGKILTQFGVKLEHPEAIVFANALTTNIIS